MQQVTDQTRQIIQRFSPGFQVGSISSSLSGARSVEKTHPQSSQKPDTPSNFFFLLRLRAVDTLKGTGRINMKMKNAFIEQSSEPLPNRLRIHRRGASLSQREVGRLLGYDSDVAISRQERFRTIPPFLIALAYQVLFRVPASEMFPGIIQTVELGVEQRLTEFENQLRDESARGARSATIKRKLEWLRERRNTGRG